MPLKSTMPLHGMNLLTLTHDEPAPYPNIKRFKNTFFVLMYLTSEL